MPVIEFLFPLGGLHKGSALEAQPARTSPHLKNVRPYDVLETRVRGGQRPGLAKRYSQIINSGGEAAVIVELLEVSVVIT